MLWYFSFGYNTWRDPMKPSQILERLCKKFKMDPPEYSHVNKQVICGGLTFTASTKVEMEGGLYFCL